MVWGLGVGVQGCGSLAEGIGVATSRIGDMETPNTNTCEAKTLKESGCA